MAKKLSLIASSMNTGAAAVGAACNPAVSTAEIQDLCKVITVLASRGDISDMAIGLCVPSFPTNLLPG